MIHKIFFISLLCFFTFVFLGSPLLAQEKETPKNVAQTEKSASPFFSTEELLALTKALAERAKRTAQRLLQSQDKPSNPSDETENGGQTAGTTGEDAPPIQSPRVLTLSGLVYGGRQDWTFWLNGMRVTPETIPPLITDLHVRKDKVHFQWQDVQTAKIYAVELRPHESFDLDRKLFSTGLP